MLNESVDRSLILPDEYKHIVSPMQAKINKIKKIIIALTIFATLMLILCIVFLAVPSSLAGLQNQNSALQSSVAQLRSKGKELNEQLQTKHQLNQNLSQKQKNISNQLQQNNELIIYLEGDIKLNCNISRQRLRLNSTNMNSFALSIQSTNMNDNPPIMVFLNVSDNQLTTFSDNSLPHVEQLHLRNNPIIKISNNKLDTVNQILGLSSNPILQQFSNNYIPLIQYLDLSNSSITVFNNNTLTSATFLNLSQNKIAIFNNITFSNLVVFDISNNSLLQFSDNKFPSLIRLSAWMKSTTDTKTFSKNFFGRLFSLHLFASPLLSRINFSSNYLPALNQLIIENIQLQYSTLKSNQMPILVYLSFYSSMLTGFQYLPELRGLFQLSLTDTKVDKFSGHDYPELVKLHLNYTEISQFTNNKLPTLEQLVIINLSTSIYSVCDNVVMPNLKRVMLQFGALSSISCLNKLPNLQFLSLNNHNLNSFDSYSFPKLETLTLSNDFIRSFQNNSLPALTNLTLDMITDSFSLASLQSKLESLQINAPIDQFTNYNFSLLKQLTIISTQDNTIHFINNTMPKLEKLTLWHAKQLDNCNLPSLRYMEINYSNNFQYDYLSYDKGLEYFSIDSSKMDKFRQHTMPNLKTLKITNCQLSNFAVNDLPQATHIQLNGNALDTVDCVGLPSVCTLDLSRNAITDAFVDSLVSCNLKTLTHLNLTFNMIANAESARNKLSNKYPNASIYL